MRKSLKNQLIKDKITFKPIKNSNNFNIYLDDGIMIGDISKNKSVFEITNDKYFYGDIDDCNKIVMNKFNKWYWGN